MHVDATVMLERPKLAPHREAIRDSLAARRLGSVNVKATTGEGMGFVGRGEGAAALAVATIAEPAARADRSASTTRCTRRGAPLEPRDPGKVGIYACGPTVYSRIHVGNARPFVVFSLLKRFLEHEGYDVTLVANITDINDKIYDAARAAGRRLGASSRGEMTAALPATTPSGSGSAGPTTSRWRPRRSSRSST